MQQQQINSQQQQLNPSYQHQLQRQVNADFGNMSLSRDGTSNPNTSTSMEEMLYHHHRQQQETTYASVLRQNNNQQQQQQQQQQQSQSMKQTNNEQEKNGDPFAVLRELGHKATTATNGGLYQYFS